MRFFEEQERARRKSRQLVVLFLVALVAMEIALNGIMWAVFAYGADAGSAAAKKMGNLSYSRSAPMWVYWATTISSLAVVLGAALFRSRALKAGGGAEVAAMAGGSLVNEFDPLERRFLNVVQEMSLASGTPMPQVFVMRREGGINAFAAGWSIEDAAICVTRGCLEALTRDELQGVVAHEFSHIHNADMRLNIRAMGLLYGLYTLTIVGREILDLARFGSLGSSRDEKGSGVGLMMALMALGLGFLVMGAIGQALGLAISAAISRQREFLADASAVQFTRNPEGIGGALRKIGGMSGAKEVGSAVAEPKALALSHMFLGAATYKLADGLLATHPPLDDRIERVYGRKMDYLVAPARPRASQNWPEAVDAAAPNASLTGLASGFAAGAMKAGRIDPNEAIDFARSAEGLSVARDEDRREEQPSSAASFMAGAGVGSPALSPAVRKAASNPAGARSLCLALMAATQNLKRTEAEDRARESLVEAEWPSFKRLLAELDECDPSWHVAIVDAASGALRGVPAAQKDSLLSAMGDIAKLDGKVSLREQALFQVAKRRMSPPRGMGKAHLSDRQKQAGVAVAWVARLGGGSKSEVSARLSRALLLAKLPVDESASGIPVWAELDVLAPMQKPALAKAFALAAGDSDSGRDGARIACALIGCPAPFTEFPV